MHVGVGEIDHHENLGDVIGIGYRIVPTPPILMPEQRRAARRFADDVAGAKAHIAHAEQCKGPAQRGMAARPDLVHGARYLAPAENRRASRRRTVGLVAAGLAVAVGLAWFVAPLASDDPDGLERVAIDQGFADTARDSVAGASPVAGYEVDGVEGETSSTRIAGLVGIAATFAVRGRDHARALVESARAAGFDVRRGANG